MAIKLLLTVHHAGPGSSSSSSSFAQHAAMVPPAGPRGAGRRPSYNNTAATHKQCQLQQPQGPGGRPADSLMRWCWLVLLGATCGAAMSAVCLQTVRHSSTAYAAVELHGSPIHIAWSSGCHHRAAAAAHSAAPTATTATSSAVSTNNTTLEKDGKHQPLHSVLATPDPSRCLWVSCLVPVLCLAGPQHDKKYVGLRPQASTARVVFFLLRPPARHI